MQQRIHGVTLGVADLERARRFYEEGLGWKPSPESRKDFIFFHAGGTVFSLIPWDKLAKDIHLPHQLTGFGGIVLAFNVRERSDVDRILEEAQRADATLLKSGEKNAWGGYSGCFADPDGHPWEVSWNPFWSFTEDGRIKDSD